MGVNSNNCVKPNPRLRLVELWLGWRFDNCSEFPPFSLIASFTAKVIISIDQQKHMKLLENVIQLQLDLVRSFHSTSYLLQGDAILKVTMQQYERVIPRNNFVTIPT